MDRFNRIGCINGPAINTAGIILAEAEAEAEAGAGVGIASIAGRPAGQAIYSAYVGLVNGKPVYAGIINNLVRRASEHCPARFDELFAINGQSLTRDQARAVEQVFRNNNPNFENIINSISPQKAWYDEAIRWANGYLGL